MAGLLTQVLAMAAAVAPEVEVEGARKEEGAIVVTASRLDDLPGSTTRIERIEIERRNSPSLLESLDDAAGVRAFSTGGPAGRSFLSIRGGEPNFTLVLLEGMRLNDPTNSRGGGFDFFLLDPWLVEAVAISRGAGSPVHGADALSGVVNIALRRPRSGESEALGRLSAGSGQELGAALSLSHGWAGGGLLTAASWHQADALERGSILDRRQALARLRQEAGPVEFAATGLYGRAERNAWPEDSGGPRHAPSQALERGVATLEAVGATVQGARGGRLRPRLSLSYVRQADAADTPPISDGVYPGTPALTADSRIGRFEAVADAAFEAGPLTVGAGVAWLEEDGRSRGTIDFGFPLPVEFELERRTRSAFAEARVEGPAGLSVDAAARHDHVAGRGGRWTGRVGGAWRASPDGPTLFARIGEGYKLPSFYALGHPLVGNPDLAPERSRNAVLGVEWRGGRFDLVRLALFDNRFRHLIDFDPQSFRIVNRDRVETRGIEAEAQWRPAAGVGVAASLTWLDIDSPTPLRGRPSWQGSVRAYWAASETLELNARLAANSWFHDSAIPTGLIRAGGHVEADLGLRWRFARRFSLAATLHNLAGSRHEEAVGFPAAGPTLRAGLDVALF